MAGPVARTYKAGSIIYFEGDRGEEVYVLQKGRIILISTSLDQTEEHKEDVKRGEFFGVKSSLGHYPREETAQVLTDSIVLVFSAAQFEALSLKNTRLVLQMLKVFSAQLRKVHGKVRELLGERSMDESSIELIKVAEYYYKHNELDHALRAYEAYLKHWPEGVLRERAQRMSQNLKKGQSYPLDAAPLDEELDNVRPNQSAGFGDDMGMSMGSEPISGDADLAAGSVDDLSPPPLDDMGGGDFSLDADPAALDAPASSEDTPSSFFYAGLNEFSQGNYDGAVSKFKACLAVKSMAPSEATFIEQAEFEMAKTYVKMSNFDEGLKQYTHFIKKFPHSERQKKAFMAVAEIYEKKGDSGRAISVYTKVAGMAPQDRDSNQAAEKAKKLAGK